VAVVKQSKMQPHWKQILTYLCGVIVTLVGAPEYFNLIGKRRAGTDVTLVHLQTGHVNVKTQEALNPEK